MVPFLEACGATGPIVLEVEGPDERVSGRRVFEQPAIRIGASRSADLVLAHPEIRRRQAYLQVVGGHLFGMDLSRRAEAPNGWLRPSDWLTVGPFRLRAQIGESPATAESAAEGIEELPSALSRAYAQRHAYPAATLLITGSRDAAETYPVTRVLTLIGRDPSCKIRLQATKSSLYYGALVRTPQGLWFVDLLSSQRMTVNGRHVRQARLRDGDRLQVGRYELCVNLAGSDDRGRKARPSDDLLEAWPALRLPRSLSETSSSGSLEPALQPVLDQVASMRQELGDQFQQALLMISHLFGAMHNDHMRIVREELEQVRILTREIQALRTDPPSSTEPTVVDDAPLGSSALSGLPGSAEAAPTQEPPPPARHNPQEIEALVRDRLARYEAERQGRWGRVLQVLEDLRKRGLGPSTS